MNAHFFGFPGKLNTNTDPCSFVYRLGHAHLYIVILLRGREPKGISLRTPKM